MNVRVTAIASIATALAALVALPAAPALAAERPASTAVHAAAATPAGAPAATPAGPAAPGKPAPSSTITLPHNPTPQPKGQGRVGDTPPGGQYQGISESIAAKGTTGLVWTVSDIHADHNTTPANRPNGGYTDFQMWQDYPSWWPAYGSYGTMTARIYDHGKPTAFWVQMYASVYYYPYDKASCTIFQGDPSVDGTQIDFSPYTCGATSVDHSDPWKISFTVDNTPAINVTDPLTQSTLLSQACEGASAEQDCFYTPTSVQYIQDKPRAWQSPVENPTDLETKTRLTSEHTYTTENSIGIDYSTKLTLWKIWSNSLSINYTHTWIDTRSESQSVDVPVPPHTQVWLTMAATLDKITGDFLVRQNGKVYSITGATVTMPDANQAPTIVINKAPISAKAVGRLK